MLKNALSDFVLWYLSTIKNSFTQPSSDHRPFETGQPETPSSLSGRYSVNTEGFMKNLSLSVLLYWLRFIYMEFSPLTVLGNPQMFWYIFNSGFVAGSVGGIKSLLGRWGPFVSFIVWNQRGGKSLLTFTFLLQCIVQRFPPPLPRNDQIYLESFKKIQFSWSLICMESKSADLL